MTAALIPAGSASFDASIAVEKSSSVPGQYRRRLDPKFGGPYGTYGGYSAMIGMRAIMDELQSFPHCISLSTEFLTSPKADAEIVVNVTVIRKGKSFATASCVVSEPNGTPVVACLGTFGTLSGEGVEESPMHGHYSRPPAIPPHPEDAADGFILMWTAGWGDPSHPNVNGFPAFAGNFDFKTTKAHFDDVLKKIKVSRTLEAGHETRVDLGLDLDLWVSTKDGREMDCFTAAGLSDFLGSLNYGILFMRDGSDTPPGSASPHNTVSHTVHFFAPPTPNSRYLRIRPHMLIRRGKHVEYEVTVWRDDGAIVAVGRQVALARPLFLKAKV